jgi:hypothetical protein
MKCQAGPVLSSHTRARRAVIEYPLRWAIAAEIADRGGGCGSELLEPDELHFVRQVGVGSG